MSDDPAALRSDAARILRAAIEGAAPGPRTAAALARAPELADARRVLLLAFGKAAAAMARPATEILAGRIAAGLVVTPHGAPTVELPGPVRWLSAAHPLPDEHSVRAAEAAQALLAAAGPGDLVLALISGGGSSLLTAPAPGLGLADVAEATRALQHAGVDIGLLNRVRRRIDLVKGGRLAALAAPARVLCLAVSDVPGDDPATIASGPFTPAPESGDLVEEIERLGVPLPAPVVVALRRDREEHRAVAGSAQPGYPLPAGTAAAGAGDVRYEIVASNRQALDAAAATARALGYRAGAGGFALAGDAAACGLRVAAAARATDPGTALLFGGETTVTVRGPGRGGRNQELALAAAIRLAGTNGLVVGAVGTDGVDGSSAAAGAIVDGDTAARIAVAGIEPRAALSANDSHTALQAVGATLVTGPTGTNVMDVVVTLRARAAGREVGSRER